LEILREVNEIYIQELLNPFKKEREDLSKGFVEKIDGYIKRVNF